MKLNRAGSDTNFSGKSENVFLFLREADQALPHVRLDEAPVFRVGEFIAEIDTPSQD